MGLVPEKECLKEDEDRAAFAAGLHALMKEAGGQVPADVDPGTATEPQPVVSCGVKSGDGLNITSVPEGKTPASPV
jgi:hypothetical protein